SLLFLPVGCILSLFQGKCKPRADGSPPGFSLTATRSCGRMGVFHLAAWWSFAMKITDVRAVQLTRRLDRPQRNSREGRSERRFTFVLVETDAGLTGLGDAYGDQALMPTIIDRRLGPMALGLDPCAIDTVCRQLLASRAFWETGGSVLCGVSAIEVACWDIRGEAEAVPRCALLGGARRPWLDAYATDL